MTTSAIAQAMPPSLAAEKADDIKQFRATLAALYSDAADEHGVAVSMQFFASVGVKPEEAEDVGRTNLGGMQEGALPVWFPDETAAESFFFPFFFAQLRHTTRQSSRRGASRQNGWPRWRPTGADASVSVVPFMSIWKTGRRPWMRRRKESSTMRERLLLTLSRFGPALRQMRVRPVHLLRWTHLGMVLFSLPATLVTRTRAR